MNREHIENMKAGREMDGLIAEKVLGWFWKKVPPDADGKNYGSCLVSKTLSDLLDSGDWDWPKKGKIDKYAYCKNYSTNISDAFEVVNTKAQQYTIKEPSNNGNVFVMIQIATKQGMATADTVPLAICRAAILATSEE
jgi:hypothetical protein